MSNLNSPGTVQSQLNRDSPAALDARLGDVLAELITENNRLEAQVAALTTKFNAVLTKLDADAGVTDTNYSSLQAATAFTAVTTKDLESRYPGA